MPTPIKLENTVDHILELRQDNLKQAKVQESELILTLVKHYVPKKIKEQFGDKFETELEQFLAVIVLKQYCSQVIKEQVDRLAEN